MIATGEAEDGDTGDKGDKSAASRGGVGRKCACDDGGGDMATGTDSKGITPGSPGT